MHTMLVHARTTSHPLGAEGLLTINPYRHTPEGATGRGDPSQETKRSPAVCTPALLLRPEPGPTGGRSGGGGGPGPQGTGGGTRRSGGREIGRGGHPDI
ncbi:hypothetical protein GCM10010246_04310 [Streptomyces cuspidosporus]|uniref:Uncharacterized protein n=1 Tax=Streptomyces cuspidosporus TaxID=66882 RepID=A0ABP5S8K7_9ACTN